MLQRSGAISVVLCIVGLGVATTLRASREQATPRQNECIVVQHALRDVAKIKVRSSRSEVERLFVRGGGANFRYQTTYLYPECEFIGVLIEFEPDDSPNKSGFPQTDTVKEVSQLFIKYPSRD
jgi:hypothetical protein